MELEVIARIESDFKSKFGIPRQSGLINGIPCRVVFEKKYANGDALRGLEGYSHIWLIWGFSKAKSTEWSPTVRPPRLGGNKRMGVFATRSPYRPNSLGLSCVRLLSVESGALVIDGADLLNDTPIYDIKPYLPFTDSVPDASGGFADEVYGDKLDVKIDDGLLSILPKEKREPLLNILKSDIRPAYHNDESRVYGFEYAGFEIRFYVKDGIVRVTEIMQK